MGIPNNQSKMGMIFPRLYNCPMFLCRYGEERWACHA